MDRSDVTERGRQTLCAGVLKVIKVTLDAPRLGGGVMRDVSREIVVRPDAAAALVHDTERDVFILAEQFRFPVYERGGAWLAEIVAGTIDGEETPEACIRREIEEEVGYRAGKVEPIAIYFSAPGYSTERVHLFYAPVTPADLVNPGARGVDAGEDIQRLELTKPAFLDRLDKRDFEDGKTLALAGWALKRFGQHP